MNISKKINNIVIKLKNLFFKNDKKINLPRKAIRGGFWVLALKIIGGLFNLARIIIIARVLAPHDFGLMGIALLTIGILEVFSQTGFQSALIQKKKDIKSYLDSAWTVSILRGFVLFTILYFLAPCAALFFKTPIATSIIRTVGLSILLQAFTNIAVVYFQKELEFNKQFFYQLSGILADFVVAVSLAIIFKNVWALVFGLLAGNFVRLILSYFIHPYRPHFTKNFKKAKELFVFGKWVLGSSIIIFLTTQGDDVLVGKILGITMLGFYQMAYKISNLPATQITHVISQVTFPTYSKLQNNLPKLRKAYLRVLQLTGLLSIPLAGIIIILSPEFIKIFLGHKWMPMATSMQILAIWGAVRSIGATSGGLFYSKGRPDIVTKLTMIKLIILSLLIYPLTKIWGLPGTSLAVVGAALFSSPIGSYIVIKKIIKCKIWSFCKQIIFPLIATIAMMLIVLLTKNILGATNIFNFFILVIIGALVYVTSILIIDYFSKYNIKLLLKNILRSIK